MKILTPFFSRICPDKWPVEIKNIELFENYKRLHKYFLPAAITLTGTRLYR